MTVILGTSRSGKSLVAGIVNCVPGMKIHNIQIEDERKSLKDSLVSEVCLINVNYSYFCNRGLKILDDLNQIEAKIIWVVRNPIQSICSCMQNMHLSSERAFAYWFDVNTIFWYFCSSKNYFLIKYEDAIMSPEIMKKMFGFMGLEHNDQYHRYGDFDQPTLNCPIFDKGEIAIEKITSYQPSYFCLEDKCKIFCNKKLLDFLNYKLNILD